jgi:hypothetical protein
MQLQECITRSYRMANVLKRPGRGLSNSELEEGRHIYNSILDGLKAERLFVYQELRTIVAVTALKPEYLVGDLGVGADWNLPQITRIDRAGWIMSGTLNLPNENEIPMQVVLSYQQFQLIIDKNVQSTWPQVLYFRAAPSQGSSGPLLGTARLWPVPQANGNAAVYTQGTVDEFTDVESTIEFPLGYREFLEYRGACAVNDAYPGRPISQRVERLAREYKQRIAANQATPMFIRADRAVMQGNRLVEGSGYNILLGPGGYYPQGGG